LLTDGDRLLTISKEAGRAQTPQGSISRIRAFGAVGF
jgi:hypothetical protein